jgi:hypothetical protein
VKVDPNARRALVPVGVVALTSLVVCAVAAAVLVAVGYRMTGANYLKSYRGPTSAEMRLAMAMDYAQGSAEDNDVVLLGDATCESISMADLARGAEVRAWSLCVVGLVEWDGLARILSTYLEHHPAPRLVVIVRHPYSLLWSQTARSPALTVNRYDYLRHFEPESSERPLTLSDELLLNLQEGWWDVVGLASGVLGHPLNALVNDCGAADGTGGGDGLALSPRPVLPDTYYRCPGVPLSEVRDAYARSRGAKGGALKTFQTELDLHNDDHSRGKWEVMETGHRLDAINLQATQRHIPMMLRLSPVMAGTGAQADVIAEWARDVMKSSPGITVAEPHLLEYDRALFEDRLHVNTAGADRFTGQMIEDVRAALGRGRKSTASVAPAGP